MMNDRLERSQQERIEEWYHDHPLLIACQSAFKSYQAGMHYLMFSPTEVFVEAINVLDDLLEEGTDAINYIHNLWDNLIIRYKLWYVGAPEDDEFHTAVSAVCYTVAVALSRHEDNYYSETVKDAILDEIAAHTNIIKQEEDKVLVSLSSYADGIDTWMNEYIKRDDYLSDDIYDVANGKKPKPWKTTTQKTSKNHCSKEKIVKLHVGPKDYSRYSFKLNVKDKQLENLYLMLSQRDDKGKRFIDGDLQEFNETTKCLPLDKEDIKHYKPVDIDKMLFNQVFTGKETDVQIVWRGDAVELWYFINTLNNYKVKGERLLDKSGSGPGIWQIVRSRFLNGKSRKVIDERTGKEVEIDEPIEFGEDAFRKYSQKNSLSDPSVLDAIIRKIAPPRDKTDKEEIEEDLNPLKYGIRPPSAPEQLGEDLYDTSHKSKY